MSGLFVEADVPPEWPLLGAITFDRVSLRYADSLPAVVKHIIVDISPGEKVCEPIGRYMDTTPLTK